MTITYDWQDVPDKERFAPPEGVTGRHPGTFTPDDGGQDAVANPTAGGVMSEMKRVNARTLKPGDECTYFCRRLKVISHEESGTTFQKLSGPRWSDLRNGSKFLLMGDIEVWV